MAYVGERCEEVHCAAVDKHSWTVERYSGPEEHFMFYDLNGRKW